MHLYFLSVLKPQYILKWNPFWLGFFPFSLFDSAEWWGGNQFLSIYCTLPLSSSSACIVSVCCKQHQTQKKCPYCLIQMSEIWALIMCQSQKRARGLTHFVKLANQKHFLPCQSCTGLSKLEVSLMSEIVSSSFKLVLEVEWVGVSYSDYSCFGPFSRSHELDQNEHDQ